MSPPSRCVQPADLLLHAVQAATTRLLLPSEQDHPWQADTWTQEPTAEALAQRSDADDRALRTEESVQAFFGPLIKGLGETVEAERYQVLLDLLQKTLANTRVVTIGGVDRTVWVVGQWDEGIWLTLRSKLVET